jgi:hypothetical protein
MLQFSTKQLFIILSATALSTVAVFSLGVLSASLVSAQAEPPVAAQRDVTGPAVVEADACDGLIVPIVAPEVVVQQPADAATITPRYGLQVAVFDQLDNAIAFAARHRDGEFRARVFRRPARDTASAYPVLVGLYGDMADAQQAKQTYRQHSPAEVFVTDASRLQEEILLEPVMAMLP